MVQFNFLGAESKIISALEIRKVIMELVRFDWILKNVCDFATEKD